MKYLLNLTVIVISWISISCATYSVNSSQRQLANALKDNDLQFLPSCQYSKEATHHGLLDVNTLNEASGLAVSKQYNHLYHINDSDADSALIVSDLNGQNLKKIKVKHTRFIDAEDLSYGECFENEYCLIVADIGVLRGNRSNGDRALYFFIESHLYDKNQMPVDEIEPDLILPLSLPFKDSVDAESFAIHPKTKDLFILTKHYDLKKKEAYEHHLLKIPFKAYSAFTPGSLLFTGIKPEVVASFDLKKIYPDQKEQREYGDWVWQVPTSMDIHPDGKKFIVLNYMTAIEFFFDLSEDNNLLDTSWDEGKNYQVIPLEYQPVQEAIAYNLEGDGFYYTSEFSKRFPKKLPELLSYKCRQ
ncbi:MAG: hypothetical protein KDD50_10660 [Bdellovibrionales bacterium]|nr:hypothetical protein [Bdellovibrionales bacterium]